MEVAYDKQRKLLKYDRKLKCSVQSLWFRSMFIYITRKFHEEAFKLRNIITNEETSNKPCRYTK